MSNRVRYPDERPQGLEAYQRYESRRGTRPSGSQTTERCLTCKKPCRPEFRRCRPCEIQTRKIHKCRYCDNLCKGAQCRECHRIAFLCQAGDKCFNHKGRDAKFCKPCAAKLGVTPKGAVLYPPVPPLQQGPLPTVAQHGQMERTDNLSPQVIMTPAGPIIQGGFPLPVPGAIAMDPGSLPFVPQQYVGTVPIDWGTVNQTPIPVNMAPQTPTTILQRPQIVKPDVEAQNIQMIPMCVDAETHVHSETPVVNENGNDITTA